MLWIVCEFLRRVCVFVINIVRGKAVGLTISKLISSVPTIVGSNAVESVPVLDI